MKEKDITPKLLACVRADKRFGSGLYEIKLARGRVLRAGAVAEHQARALRLAWDVVAWKIPDCGFQNPADFFMIKGGEGWLVVWFQLERGVREVWALDGRLACVQERRKITVEMAREEGVRLVL